MPVVRKQPRQARSREMVERIIVAARQVLVRDGYDALTTNRVATQAEVSPGSLYQYFPDKAAIVEILVDRYWDEVAERVAATLSDRIGLTDPEAIVRGTADALLSALEADRPLLQVVAEELPLARSRDRRLGLERRVRDLLATYLALRPEIAAHRDPQTAAWILTLAMENLALRWVIDAPPLDRAVLLDEITTLVGGYLSEVPSSGASTSTSTADSSRP